MLLSPYDLQPTHSQPQPQFMAPHRELTCMHPGFVPKPSMGLVSLLWSAYVVFWALLLPSTIVPIFSGEETEVYDFAGCLLGPKCPAAHYA